MSVRVDIEGIDFEKSNVIFVNGMSLEKVKIKYNWLLNAKVKDAIIGENDRGIVWYFGDWYCGEWEDGTWYSGNFYTGIWKNGIWFSYQLDKFDVLNEVFFIRQTGDNYSTFHNGLWMGGSFYSGTFGVSGTTESWEDFNSYNATYEGYDYINFRKESATVGGAIQYEEKSIATWVSGIFQNGEFYNAIWNDGRHVNGDMTNSMWINGLWFNGTFDGNTWYNGYWYNGNFINGNWMNGTFSKLKSTEVSRFGNTTLDTDNYTPICNWYDGTWKNGEWFSGLVTGSTGEILDSTKNYLSVWYAGTWENGIWYGGHFKTGTWKNGVWKNGIFGFLNATEWTEPIYTSQPDMRMNSLYKWSGDTVMPTVTTSSINVTSSNTSNTYYELTHYVEEIPITLTAHDIALSSITFTQSNIVSFEFDNFNFITNTSVTNRYDFNELSEWCDIYFYINAIECQAISITKVGLTWTAILDDINLPLLISTPQKVRIRRKIKLDSGTGSGMTYWGYNNIYSDSNTSQQNIPAISRSGPSVLNVVNISLLPNVVKFVGTSKTDFLPGEYVYIEQNRGYTNESYNGIAKVISTGYTSGSYYMTVTKKYKTNAANDSGKIVKYSNVMASRSSTTSSMLSFQDFDFNYDFITDLDTTLVNGYMIKFNTQIIPNSSYRSGYKNIAAMLPLKDLVLNHIDSSDYKTWGTDDECYYNPSYYTGYTSLGYPDIPIGKTKEVSLDYTNLEYWNFGNLGDMWGLVDDQNRGLELYYSGSTPPFDLDTYNPRLVTTSSERLRVNLRFDLDMTISQQLRLYDIQVKTFYSDDVDIPIWLNGTWNKGTWYNGDFYSGNFYSGMWIKGNFYGGSLASNYR